MNLYNPITQNDGESYCELSDNKQYQYENKFVSILVGIIVNALNINSKDRQIFQDMFFKILQTKLAFRDGMLDQYVNSQLDILIETFKREFEVEAKTDYSYSTHAKFNTLINEIKQKNKKQKKK